MASHKLQSASSRHLALHVESVDSTDSGDSQDYELQPDMEMEEAQNGSPAIEVDRSIDTDSVAIESGEIPEFEDEETKPKKGKTGLKGKIQSMAKVSSVLKVASLIKSVSIFDIEANFHGDKQMLYDPDIKFSKLGETFWRLDFRPSSLKRWGVYRENLKFLFGLCGEVICVAGKSKWGLSSIPYTTDERMYYDPWMIALYYFITLFTLFLVIGYGFFVMIYGFKESRALLLATVLPGSIVSVLPFIFVAAGVEPWFYFLDLVFYVFVGVLFNISAFVMARVVIGKADKVNSKALFLAYTTPLTLHAIVIAIYAFVIIPFYRNLNSDLVRAIFRMIIHPLICQLNLTVAAIFCKKYPRVQHQHLTTGVVFGIYVEGALFGRFLIATVGTLQSQLATSAAVGVVDIVIRLLSIKKEYLINYLQKRLGVKHLNYNEAKERAFMAQFNNNSMVVEHVSILIVPFLLHSFYKHRYAFNFSYTDTETSVGVLYQSAAMQFAIQTVVHFICCVFEYIMKVPNISVWKQERKVFVIWEMANFIQILALIVYVFKTLPSVFFCDSTDPCSCSNNSYFDLSLFFKDPANFCDR